MLTGQRRVLGHRSTLGPGVRRPQGRCGPSHRPQVLTLSLRYVVPATYRPDMTTVCVQLWAWAGDRGVRSVGVLEGAQARLATQVLVSSAAPGGGRLGRLGEPVTRTITASGLVGALVALVPPDSMVRLDGHGRGHGKAPPRVLATVGSGEGRPSWVGVGPEVRMAGCPTG